MENDVYQCPNCGVEILDVGQKVAKHKIFCKSENAQFSSGTLLKKSTMTGIFELMSIDPDDFPWGVVVRKRDNGETTITYTAPTVHWSSLIAHIGALSIYFALEIPYYLKVVCLISATLTLFYFVCNLIYMRFGRWELTFRGGKGTFFSGIGQYGQTVQFEYNSDSTIAAVTNEDFGRSIVASVKALPNVFTNIPVFVVSSLAGYILQNRYVSREGITLVTNGMEYNFGSNIPKADVINYMAAILLRATTQ